MDTSNLIPTDSSETDAEREGDERTTDHADRAQSQRRQRAKRTSVPDRATCLANLAQLPGLVALKLLTSAQANSIRAIYAEILRSIDSTGNSQVLPLADDDLLRCFRDQPELFSMLESLLSDEQIALIMREGADDEAQ